jgi:class 3 adenylate cyclase
LICEACGTPNPAGQKFCGECGVPQAAACPGCGAANPPGQKFCGECGTPIASGVARPAAAAAPSAPRPPLASGPVSERRLVTVLFADIVGFTPFAEERDAEDVRETLGRYFDTATEVVTRYGGTVEKFIGDAVMAVWGTPVVREDDAERAVRAALELVDAVRDLGAGITARAGVLTGEAAVTLGAANQGMVAGDLVNTAARLQAAAAPGTVLAGEATYRAAATAIAFEPAGDQVLKGKAAPVVAWRALRVVAERGGRGRSDALEAPFVGRDDELRLLKEMFHSTARERRARLVSITGIGGIGKSRLAWEFEKYLDGIVEAVWWHHGRSPAYGEGITFWPLGEMIRARAGVAEADDEATTREGIGRFLDRLDLESGERDWIEPALLAVLGIGSGVSPEQLFGAWRTFFERMSATGTVVLVFEDLHWADSGTLDFIDHLLEWSRNTPICIVTLARPELIERRPDWGAGRRTFSSLFLEPLPEAAMRQLLAGLVPGLSEGAVRAIVGRAEGVPLYAVETVRMLVADGKLVPAPDGRYEPTGDLADLAVPESLTALIAARLDALDRADRSLVLDAAVLGQSFPTAGLAAIAGQDPSAVEARLRGLVRRELFVLQADPRSPERGQYAFVQALIREVAYNTLAKRDRKLRHLAAARYFEAVGTDEISGALAGHYLAAHELAADADEAAALGAQARIALTAAAERARALGANEQAHMLYTQALRVTADTAERARLQLSAGESATVSGALDAGEQLLGEAIESFRAIGDVGGVASAAAALGRRYFHDYRIADAERTVRAAMDETAGSPDDPAVIGLGLVLGMTRYFADAPRDAVAALDRVLETAERKDLGALVAEALTYRGSALCDLGRSYEGLAAIDGGLRLADELQRPMIVLRGTTSKALGMVNRDPRISRQLQIEAAEMARRLGATVARHRALNNAIEYSWECGEWAWAQHTLDELDGEEMAPIDRLMVLVQRVQMDARRGLPTDALMDRIHQLSPEPIDDNVRQALLSAEIERQFAAGRYAEAARAAREIATRSALNAPVVLASAVQCDLLL